jgi:hypothetical protein
MFPAPKPRANHLPDGPTKVIVTLLLISNLTDIAKPGVEDKFTTPVVKDCAKDK